MEPGPIRRDDGTMGEERDFTRRQRVIVAAVAWVFVGPLVVGLTILSWFLGIGLAAIAVWTTWDYIRKGDLAGHVAEGMSREGLIGKAVEDTYFEAPDYGDEC
jgi:hypothetical protein